MNHATSLHGAEQDELDSLLSISQLSNQNLGSNPVYLDLGSYPVDLDLDSNPDDLGLESNPDDLNPVSKRDNRGLNPDSNPDADLLCLVKT